MGLLCKTPTHQLCFRSHQSSSLTEVTNIWFGRLFYRRTRAQKNNLKCKCQSPCYTETHTVGLVNISEHLMSPNHQHTGFVFSFISSHRHSFALLVSQMSLPGLDPFSLIWVSLYFYHSVRRYPQTWGEKYLSISTSRSPSLSVHLWIPCDSNPLH